MEKAHNKNNKLFLNKNSPFSSHKCLQNYERLKQSSSPFFSPILYISLEKSEDV
jgi:hypothetical protein